MFLSGLISDTVVSFGRGGDRVVQAFLTAFCLDSVREEMLSEPLPHLLLRRTHEWQKRGKSPVVFTSHTKAALLQ